MARFHVGVAGSLILILGPALAQLSVSPQTSTTMLLQQSLAAQLGNTQVFDTTLNGTVRRIAGSDDESGTVVYMALPSSSRLAMTLPSGAWLEIRSSGLSPTGQWSGPDGVVHAIPVQNLLVDSPWFPVFLLSNLGSSVNTVVTYVGPETLESGVNAIHLTATQQFPDIPGDSGVLLQHLSQVEIFLSSTTSLPLKLTFDSHPDTNVLTNFKTEIAFSDYRNVNGAQIPFHVQKSVNGSLMLDLQFQSVSLNSGITPTQIAPQ